MAQREDWGRSPPQERVLYVAPPSIERLTVPLLLVVSALCFVGWATWFGTTAINKIQENITEISNNLKNYIERSDARVLRIEEALDKRTDERLTKFDHEIWCLRTERLNPNWKCGGTQPPRSDETESPAIWSGKDNWKTSTKDK